MKDLEVPCRTEKGASGSPLSVEQPRARKNMRDGRFRRSRRQTRECWIECKVEGRVRHHQGLWVGDVPKGRIATKAGLEDPEARRDRKDVILDEVSPGPGAAKQGEGQPVEGTIGYQDEAVTGSEQRLDGRDQSVIEFRGCREKLRTPSFRQGAAERVVQIGEALGPDCDGAVLGRMASPQDPDDHLLGKDRVVEHSGFWGESS